ncbi:M60 family metallopeptidase [Spiroplasma endosymbiont of Thecophora atra]|uniref:M60 family metallopeptidase n=1 Tax=Spiroplasma endosymbiont of Thecophora atra TaxID=3066294 RepID=UPI0030CD694A
MFWQLDQAFGKWFYSTLNQSCRLLDDKLLPTDNELKKQFFIQMTSKIANRNLIPFFAKWGIKTDEDTEKIVSKYPKLTKEIWNNIFDGHYDDNAIVEHELRSYQPVQEVKVISFLEKSIGDEILKNEVKENIMMEDNLEVESVKDISYQKPDFLDKKSIDTNFVIIDRNEDFVGNKYQIPVKLNFVNSILLEGMGQGLTQYRAIINLNKTKKTFFISGNNEKFNIGYGGSDYIKITIKDANGNSIYKKVAVGKDPTSVFDDLNEINYKNNYMIIFWFMEPKRGLYFDPSVGEWVSSTTKNVEFVVSDDKLIKKNIS